MKLHHTNWVNQHVVNKIYCQIRTIKFKPTVFRITYKSRGVCGKDGNEMFLLFSSVDKCKTKILFEIFKRSLLWSKKLQNDFFFINKFDIITNKPQKH